MEVVDLTQPLNASTPIIQLPPPFANTPGFKSHEISNYDAKGPAWYWNWIEIGEHVGTHFDAPCHWVTGKDKPCVDEIEAQQFVGPAAVIDVTADVAKSADFVADAAGDSRVGEDARAHPEGRVGHSPHRVGQPRRRHQGVLQRGADGSPHYPGFGKDSATFLTTERDILGVGTEAVGTDAAVGAQADPPFPNHSIMHGAGKFGLTQLANVDKLPATGALVIAAAAQDRARLGQPGARHRAAAAALIDALLRMGHYSRRTEAGVLSPDSPIHRLPSGDTPAQMGASETSACSRRRRCDR